MHAVIHVLDSVSADAHASRPFGRMPMDRRSFLWTVPGALAGCVVVGGTPGAPAQAPTYRPGDRWIYRARDGYRQPVTWDETREVVAVGSDGIIVFRITQKGPQVDTEREERLVGPGLVAVGAVFDNETRRFAPPLERYRFPLTSGATWAQTAPNFNDTLRQEDPLLASTIVGGWDPVTVPAGTYDALLLRILMQLNLNDPFRWPTQCNYLFAWSPAVNGTVREERYATYRERGDRNASVEFRAQNALLELVSYRPGGN